LRVGVCFLRYADDTCKISKVGIFSETVEKGSF
jgi:hypothetical protein